MDIRPVTNLASPSSQLTADRQAGAASAVAHAAAQTSTPVETANPVQQPANVPNQSQLKQAVEDINKTIAAFSRDVEFSIDSDTDRTVVKVIDQNTKEVIRQIPSQETLEIAKAITHVMDKVQGLLIKQKA